MGWVLMGCAGLEVGKGHHMLVAAAVEDKAAAADVAPGRQHHPYNRAQECQQDG